jgi:hypothetical protein
MSIPPITGGSVKYHNCDPARQDLDRVVSVFEATVSQEKEEEEEEEIKSLQRIEDPSRRKQVHTYARRIKKSSSPNQFRIRICV